MTTGLSCCKPRKSYEAEAKIKMYDKARTYSKVHRIPFLYLWIGGGGNSMLRGVSLVPLRGRGHKCWPVSVSLLLPEAGLLNWLC